MAKHVQITLECFIRLVRYFYIGDTSEEVYRGLQRDIEAKLDSMAKHELYTAYKTGDTAQERDKARKAYLDRIGMRDSFRWKGESDDKDRR